MIVFPPAKINIGLDVLKKRSDGFHHIRSIFYPIPLLDALEIIASKDGETTLTTSGLEIPGDPKDNLCLKAYQLLKDEFDIPACKIHLRKNIPMGAGLGGGSSDGAHTLRLLNDLFTLNLSEEDLMKKAAELGSDCPFFIQEEAMLVTGRGEVMNPHNLDLSGFWLELLMPEFEVPTGAAYGSIQPATCTDFLKDLSINTIFDWQDEVKNDFESGSLEQYGRIRKIKEELIEQGALYASMTGSGSAVYGLFDYKPDIEIHAEKVTHFQFEL